MKDAVNFNSTVNNLIMLLHTVDFGEISIERMSYNCVIFITINHVVNKINLYQDGIGSILFFADCRYCSLSMKIDRASKIDLAFDTFKKIIL